MRLLRTYSNLVYLLEGLWRVLIKKKWGSNKKRDSIVKCGQTSFEEGGGEACENPVGLSMCDGPVATFFVKLWVPIKR